MALWTASLFDADGVMRAGMGYGMYAQGDTAQEAQADAARQLLVECETTGLDATSAAFIEKTNAAVRDMRARGYRIEVHRKR